MDGEKIVTVSEDYKSALADLTFNSKPMINLLTMLADENRDCAQGIVQAIYERIKQVAVDQKLPALYLLDSILKNLGGEYVGIISQYITETFCHVFEHAKDERKRMQLFKLRNTWVQYIPNKTLYELDVKTSKFDPNWPIAAPAKAQPVVPVTTSITTTPALQKIHINPKFLQKVDESTIAVTIASIAAGKADKVASKLQNKITKERLLEEERRVQDRLKVLQADKLKRERVQHEASLKQQQLEREHLLAEQKRQLEVLKKQQQSMASSKSNVKPSIQSHDRSKEMNKSQGNLHFTSNNNPVKDPRIRSNSQSDESRKGHLKSSSAAHKNSSGRSAVNVLNKIMTGLHPKKPGCSSKKQPFKSTVPPASSRNEPPERRKENNNTSQTPQKISKDQTNDQSNAHGNVGGSNKSVNKEATVSKVPVSLIPPIPLPSAFSQLSNRDMQIAAQAAAIATAMHQMQANTNSDVDTGQSATLAAKLIQLVQSTPNVEPESSDKQQTESHLKQDSHASSMVTKDAKSESIQRVMVEKHGESEQLMDVDDKQLENRGRDLHNEPPYKKAKGEEIERPRKARARSPSRYHFRMERKIEGDKRPDGKDISRQRKISEDNDLDDIDLPEVGERYSTPAGPKPERFTQEEWNELRKIRKKEFRTIRGRILETENENPYTFQMEVFDELMAEILDTCKRGSISTEQSTALQDILTKTSNLVARKIRTVKVRPGYDQRYPPDGMMEQRQWHPNPPGIPERSNGNSSFPRDAPRQPGFRHDRSGPWRPHMNARPPLESRHHIREEPPFRHERIHRPEFRNGPMPHTVDPYINGRREFIPRDNQPNDMRPFGPRNRMSLRPRLGHAMHDGPRPHIHGDHPPRGPLNDRGHPYHPGSRSPNRWNDGPRHLERDVLPFQRNLHPEFDEKSRSPFYGSPIHESPMEDQSPLNVQNLLGQLVAAGVLNTDSEPVDLKTPDIKMCIEDLKKRHKSVINHLFLGEQCSSCGQRFPSEDPNQYREHLDWHFRQNRKEKDGVRKVSSRAWYYDVSNWIEHDGTLLVKDEDGKLQSMFFESERTSKEETDSESPAKKKKSDDCSVVVTSDDGDAVCSVCMEPLEQFWSEELDEWRYKSAVRENLKLYHYHCFKDYIPFEMVETTPITTPTTLVSFLAPKTNEFLTIKEEPVESAEIVEMRSEDAVEKKEEATVDVKMEEIIDESVAQNVLSSSEQKVEAECDSVSVEGSNTLKGGDPSNE